MLMKFNGLIDIPAHEYHADKNVVGHSALVEMLRSPKHFWHRLNAPHQPTPAMLLGTAVHTAVLEPHVFKQDYVVSPKFDRRTKDGKAEAAAWEENNQGKSTISEDDMSAIVGIQSAVAEHRGASELLRDCVTEQSYFWTDEDTNISCRIRPDALVVDKDGQVVAIIDLKTALNASKGKFRRTISDRGYDLQAAFYTDGLARAIGREVPFYFLAVETAAPHGVALYRTGKKTLEIGRSKYRAALQILQWCRENDRWPSYQPFGESEEIDIPHWERSLEFEDV